MKKETCLIGLVGCMIITSMGMIIPYGIYAFNNPDLNRYHGDHCYVEPGATNQVEIGVTPTSNAYDVTQAFLNVFLAGFIISCVGITALLLVVYWCTCKVYDEKYIHVYHNHHDPAINSARARNSMGRQASEFLGKIPLFLAAGLFFLYIVAVIAHWFWLVAVRVGKAG